VPAAEGSAAGTLLEWKGSGRARELAYVVVGSFRSVATHRS